jgi:uncharacterized membrane protein
MSEHHEASSSAFEISRSRLEFLFDGIFAIAMTILVLELKVPELADRHSVAEMARDLAHHGATFFSYIFTFFVLGMLWYRHNQHYRHVLHITPAMLTLHLVQLAMAASFPFCAALLGRYPTNNFTVVVYTTNLLVFNVAALLEWLVAEKAGAISDDLDPADHRRYRRRNLRACLATGVLLLVFLLRVLV